MHQIHFCSVDNLCCIELYWRPSAAVREPTKIAGLLANRPWSVRACVCETTTNAPSPCLGLVLRLDQMSTRPSRGSLPNYAELAGVSRSPSIAPSPVISLGPAASQRMTLHASAQHPAEISLQDSTSTKQSPRPTHPPPAHPLPAGVATSKFTATNNIIIAAASIDLDTFSKASGKHGASREAYAELLTRCKQDDGTFPAVDADQLRDHVRWLMSSWTKFNSSQSRSGMIAFDVHHHYLF
jgi:hypothetical protein